MRTLLGTTRDRFLLALQYQDYRNLWIATTFSASAAWALIIARGWLTFDLTGSSFWVGLVTFAAMLPQVFSSPIAGFLADRFDRVRVLQWTFALNMANNSLLAVLVMNGVDSPWILVLLALVNGTLRASQMTVSTALVPNLVAKEHLMNAIALNQATQQGARMTGALAIIPLLGFLNMEAAFWACSSFYLLAFIQVSRIGTRSTGVINQNQGFLTNLFAGFVYVYKRPTLRSIVLIVLAHCVLTMSYESLLPAISEDKLRAGSVGASYLMAGVGGGALLSSLFMAGVRNNSIRGKLYLLFALTSGLGPILLAWSGYWGVSVAATVYMGINQAGFMTISHTLIQSLTEDHVRGRVAGVYSVHIGGSMAVTNWINGAIADVFSASAVLVVGGILFFGIVVISSGNTSIRGLYFPKPEQTFAPSTAD
ncbi:MAG: MFS transporter [Chloroflexota bacterium]|nr:MFS transporter [Chloroflexota bacterium]|tara:strand:- start:53 stop:1324 length:1272 start_codon:yes stop_codon:yes gene_type:complete